MFKLEEKMSIQLSIRNYIIITLGLLISAVGLNLFLIPAKIIGGGVSGISSLVFFASGFPIGITYLIINIILILAAIRILGAQFGVKTVYGILALSGFIFLLQSLIKQPIINDDFMAAIIGGALGGAGVGLVFTQGGSTGGTDIIAMLINHYRNISPGRIFITFDLVIIASSWFIFGSLEKIVYGYVTMAVSAYTVDMVLEGAKQSVQFFIFSNQNRRIADRIGAEIKRGVTFINGRGWYSGQNQEILLVVGRKSELPLILRLVRDEDPEAFISVATVMGVYGKGFDRIKL